MDNRIRLTEAIENYKKNHGKLRKTELASKIFKGKSAHSNYVMLNFYERGHCFTLDRETVLRICQELKCSADFLFGIEPK